MKLAKPQLIFDVISLFPSMFEGPLSESIVGRAQKAGLVKCRIHNLRQWSDDPRHQKVDDRPFGGGAGMVLRAEPIYRALKAVGLTGKKKSKPWIVFLSPQGKVLSQSVCEQLRKKKHVVLLCGHYEGIDERLMDWVDQEISIGDYVLTGGEIPAMVVIDAVSRLVPGVVGEPQSVVNDSFSNGILDFPHYTRPQTWRGLKVPDVLLSGNHRKIEMWRRVVALEQTKRKRPSLLQRKRKAK